MKKILLFFCLVNGFLCFSQENRILELQKIISDSEAISNVSSRSLINQYWELADIFLQDKQNEKAYAIIIKGLKLDPWNYKYQKIAADIEISNDDYLKANSRLDFIIRNLKDLNTIYNDSLSQKKNIKKNVDAIIVNVPSLSVNNKYYLYLVTYPNISDQLVDVVSNKISNEYGISVKVINMGMDESVVGIRDKQLDEYDRIIKDVTNRYSEKTIDDFLQTIGITKADLKTRVGKKQFIYGILRGSEEGMKQWEQLELIESQYSANAQLIQMKKYLYEIMSDKYCLGTIGITSKDIYENDYNFLFGWAEKGIGILSYSRFLLDNATYNQLEKRTVMQSFSTVGLVLGVSRCSNPNCARAYPNSLEEQDRKEDKLCDDCVKNTLAIYDKYK